MLTHKQITKYARARYPRYYYYRRMPAMHENIIKYGLGAAAVIAMLENIACDSDGPTGGIPHPPELVTENEARAIIDSVFNANDIALMNDVALKIEAGTGDTVELSVDGFNDSLKTGYEYISIEDSVSDYLEYSPVVISRLNQLADQNGPYIRTIWQDYKDHDYKQYLDSVTTEFIDSLKARGVL